MTTADALLQDILDNPQDDFLRLAYADHLEEHGGAAGADRAEFIRVQVELAKVHDRLHDLSRDSEVQEGDYDRWGDLRRRSHDLSHSGYPNLGWRWAGEPLNQIPEAKYGFHRGFVNFVEVSCVDWLAHGPAIVRAAPVERVMLADKEPFVWHDVLADRDYYRWHSGHDDDGGNRPSWLPPMLFAYFTPSIAYYIDSAGHDSVSRAAALGTVSDACLAWARSAHNSTAGASVGLEYSRDGKTWYPG